MNNSNEFFYKILPFFSGMLLVYWLFRLQDNIKFGYSGRVKLDIVLCLVLCVTFVGSIVFRIVGKK